MSLSSSLKSLRRVPWLLRGSAASFPTLRSLGLLAIGTKNANHFQLNCHTDSPSVNLLVPCNHLGTAVSSFEPISKEVFCLFVLKLELI